MKSKEIQAINNLNNIFRNLPMSGPAQEINNNIRILVQGLNNLDQEVKQKEQLLVQKDNVINQTRAKLETLKASKDVSVKEEFISALHKLYPADYPVKFEDWSDRLPMKQYVVNNDVKVMETNTKIYKQWLAAKEQVTIREDFINNLHKLYPDSYPARFEDWSDRLPMKKYVVNNNFQAMEKNNSIYKGWLAAKQAKEQEVKTVNEISTQTDTLILNLGDLKGGEIENTTSGTVTGDTYSTGEVGVAGDCCSSSSSSYVDVTEILI